jgi:tetratricopeptide (TPR) repeat protein
MTIVTIEESRGPNGNAVVMFDGEAMYTFAVTIRDPFEGTAQEQELEWYFEKHLEMPIYHSRAQTAATSIKSYGETLFEQVVREQRILEHYNQCDKANLTFVIVGSPEFHRYHWEALKDPTLDQPFALMGTLVRRSTPTWEITAQQSAPPPSPTINLLLVTARPHGEQDIGYRTISRPLLQQLRNLSVQVDLVRPGTYNALRAQLDTKSAGYYHAIHFDVHGALLGYEDATYRKKQATPKVKKDVVTQSERMRLEPYTGYKGFVFLESEVEGRADPVEAGELATLLQNYNIPLVILNACQSGKQVGVNETSLGSRLMAAGQQVVLAMSYSVTVTGAVKLMTELYKELFVGRDLTSAIQQARLALHRDKGRRARFNVQLELEDWLLPVVYENKPLILKTRQMQPDEARAFESRVTYHAQEPTYGFWGRDIDILRIERRVCQHNIVLIQGMGGTGKSTLLHHLGWWWQTTAFVEQVFYFGWDARDWNRQQILHEIGQALYDKNIFDHRFLPKSDEEQQAMVAETLRTQAHLLILDNLESLTSATPALDRHPLDVAEQGKLRDLLAALVGGQTKILLGSRGVEGWLTLGDNAPLKDSQRLVLHGLDAEAASGLADAILSHQGTRHYREQAETRRSFLKLMDFCAGYPLVLQIVLSNLQYQSPSVVLERLVAGDTSIDFDDAHSDKTESLIKCIEYSYNNLSPTAQTLLLCLAPFTGVFDTSISEKYINELRQSPEFVELDYPRWETTLQVANQWGLLTSKKEMDGFLKLQPILPYFLRSQLHDKSRTPYHRAIERAYIALYKIVGAGLTFLPYSRQMSVALTRLEYDNLLYALELALQRQETFITIFQPLSIYFDRTEKQLEGLAVSEWVLDRLKTFPLEHLNGLLGESYVEVLEDVAKRYLLIGQYPNAKAHYEEALAIHLQITYFHKSRKQVVCGRLYHQLGVISHKHLQWDEANQYYQLALALYQSGKERYSQGNTYHQLGRVAEAQRQWDKAEHYYQQALAIYIEFNDSYEPAATYLSLGNVAEAQGNWSKAQQYYQQALTLFIQSKDRSGQARIYAQLGAVAREQRKWVEARQFYHEALTRFIEVGDRYNESLTYKQLGVLAQAHLKWDEAQQFYQAALSLYIEFNNRSEQAAIYHNLGMVAQVLKQWTQAKEYYWKALLLKIELGERHAQITTISQMGSIAQIQGQSNEAKKCYRQALALAIEFNDMKAQGVTYAQLALIEEVQEQWAMALINFFVAFSIFSRLEDEHYIDLVASSIVRIWLPHKSDTVVREIAEHFEMDMDAVKEMLAHLVVTVSVARSQSS